MRKEYVAIILKENYYKGKLEKNASSVSISFLGRNWNDNDGNETCILLWNPFDPSLALAVKRELCLDLFLLRDRSRLI